MANVPVYNMEGKEVGTLELSDAVFGVEINEHLVHEVVVAQLANKRQGTQKAKTRGEVSGGGRKPWRQKGTGHARQGSTRAPQWKGGGVVFAPQPRDYTITLNKKEKRLALKSVLTSRVQENKFIVVDEMKFDEIKTKKFMAVLNNLKAGKALVVLDGDDEKNRNAVLSARNIQGVKMAYINKVVQKSGDDETGKHCYKPRGKKLRKLQAKKQNEGLQAEKQEQKEKIFYPSTINVYDILKYNTLIVTKEAVALIEEVYA